MHELSLMADLLRQIEKISRDNDGGRVVAVKVRLGALSHITPEHLAEHFHQSAVGSAADGARLEVVQMDDHHHPEAQDIILDSVELAV
jgi:hydrogenase nickel incorporation protein HypA/HybF